MKREIRVFNSFAEAEEADYEYYRSLTGDKKLELMLEIMAPAYEANPDLREFIELLNAHRVDYMLVGGWAFGFHATPRYTGDLDFFVRCNQENADLLKQALAGFGFSELSGFEQSFLEPSRILQFGVPPNRIDILTEISGVTFEEAWKGRVFGNLDGLKVPFIDRASLIANKQAAGRPKDLADVEALQRTARGLS